MLQVLRTKRGWVEVGFEDEEAPDLKFNGTYSLFHEKSGLCLWLLFAKGLFFEGWLFL